MAMKQVGLTLTLQIMLGIFAVVLALGISILAAQLFNVT